MDDKLTADILATCNTIGYADGDKYYKDPECLGKFFLMVSVRPLSTCLTLSVGAGICQFFQRVTRRKGCDKVVQPLRITCILSYF